MNACKHSLNGVCAKCAEAKPVYQFKYCKNKCLACKECGYFWGPGNESMNGKPVEWPGSKPVKKVYTSASVREYLEPKYQAYYAKLSVGRPPNWNTDQRSKDLFCLSQWLMDELMTLKCPDEDRRDVQDFFNRKSRAEEDLFELAAKAINSFLDGTIERYRRFKRS